MSLRSVSHYSLCESSIATARAEIVPENFQFLASGLCNSVYGCFAAFSLGGPRANSEALLIWPVFSCLACGSICIPHFHFVSRDVPGWPVVVCGALAGCLDRFLAVYLPAYLSLTWLTRHGWSLHRMKRVMTSRAVSKCSDACLFPLFCLCDFPSVVPPLFPTSCQSLQLASSPTLPSIKSCSQPFKFPTGIFLTEPQRRHLQRVSLTCYWLLTLLTVLWLYCHCIMS